jgi:hypothetical protein
VTPSDKNTAGDNLCRFTDEEIEAMREDGTKIPPQADFMESCLRFHKQMAWKLGTLGPECMTI